MRLLQVSRSTTDVPLARFDLGSPDVDEPAKQELQPLVSAVPPELLQDHVGFPPRSPVQPPERASQRRAPGQLLQTLGRGPVAKGSLQ